METGLTIKQNNWSKLKLNLYIFGKQRQVVLCQNKDILKLNSLLKMTETGCIS